MIDRDAQHLAALRPVGEHGVVVSTRSGNVSQTNLIPALRCSAPGSRCASHSTWKPLQIPTHGSAGAACSATAAMTGEKRAIAPVRR
ncbi:MAG: hypothetical protein KatS3mg010_0739 [Acidimicrobiia bacterium]|nr:MAG: hypothetical protein KatS3mg010_0739 [Acidimicrobiia bacterium]